MEQTLRAVAAFAMAILSFTGFSATVLKPGDIAIISVSSIAPKSFEFVCLVPIETGTAVKFTDDAWIDSTQSFRGNEGILTYTFPNDVPSGYIVRWVKDAPGFQPKGSFVLSTSGDNIICYQDIDTPEFIYGVGWAKNIKSNWTYLISSSGATSTSDIPAPLSMDQHTLVYLGNADSYAYKEESLHAGIKESVLQAIASPSNYSLSNTNALTISNVAFAITSGGENQVPETPTGNEISPETPKDTGNIHALSHKISSCQLPVSEFADSMLYTDNQLASTFSFEKWNGKDTLLYVADTETFVLIKDTILLDAEITDNKIEISNGDVAEWYRDGQLIASAENIEIEQVGQYSAYAQTSTGCVLKTKTFVVAETSIRYADPFIPTKLQYVDFLGRIHHNQPAIPHICSPTNKY